MTIDCRLPGDREIAKRVRRVLVDGKDAGNDVYFADEEAGEVKRYLRTHKGLVPRQCPSPFAGAFNEGGVWAESLTGTVVIEIA